MHLNCTERSFPWRKLLTCGVGRVGSRIFSLVATTLTEIPKESLLLWSSCSLVDAIHRSMKIGTAQKRHDWIRARILISPRLQVPPVKTLNHGVEESVPLLSLSSLRLLLLKSWLYCYK